MLRKVWVTSLLSVFALPAIANAHNVGHIFLPDGQCLEIASVREAPLVGKDRTQLDLVPETPNPPRDEYGVSFVGYWGQTPISPGRCPVVTGSSSIPGPSSASASSVPASSPASSRPAGPEVGIGPKKK